MIRRIILLCLIGLILGSCGSSRRTTRKVIEKKEREERVDTPSKEEINKEEVYKEEIKKEEVHKEESKEEEKIVNPVPKTGVEGYITTYFDIAQEEMRQYGVPASITLAQGILESGAGEGELVKKANNHFGIKCHNWKGAKVYHDDDEKGECQHFLNCQKMIIKDGQKG